MDRRAILLGVAAGTGAVQFLPGIALAAGAGSAEVEHGTKTAMAGTASLEIAKLGKTMGSDPKVKEFATFEVDEQTTIAEVLKAVMPAMKTPQLDPKDAATISQLKGMSAGAEFDRAFVRAQTEGHQKLLAIQEDYLRSGRDVPTVNVTKLARGMIKEHLTLLSDLTKAIG